MKRTLLLLLLLVAFGAYVYINEKIPFFKVPPVITKQQAPVKTAKPVTPETKKTVLSQLPAFFPAGPMIWIHSKDLGKIISQVKKSNFYKQAVEYKIVDPSKPFLISFETKAREKSVFSKISSQLEERTLMDLLGQEIGLALYPSEKPGTSNYLLAAKISAMTKIQEKLQRVKDSLFGDQVTVSENNYKEKTIITYKNQEQIYSFHYVITKNHILVSSSDILLKKGIDLMEGDGNNLFIHSEGFNSLFKTSDLSKAGLLFVDIEKAAPNISDAAKLNKKISPKSVDDATMKLQAFKHLGFTFKIQKGLEIKGALTINKEKAEQKLLQTIKMEPRKLKSLNFIPGSVVIYGANIFEPSLFFEQFIEGFNKAAEQKKPGAKTFGEIFQSSTGLNFEKDIIPSIGEEFFYSVSARNKTDAMQIPGITIGLEIKNREKIETLLKKLETSLAKSFQRESYKGFDINFVSNPLPIPINFQPGYAIVDNFLFLSLNQKEIKRLIDASKKKIPSLEKSKKYISTKIPLKNNGLLYMNTLLLWDDITDGIAKTPLALQAMSDQSVEKLLKFIDLIKVVRSIDGVIINGKDQINFRSFIAVKDIPKIRKKKELLAFLEKRQKAATLFTPSKPGQAKVSYDYVYNPAGKRDPFRSLIEGRQAKIKRGQTELKEKQVEAQRFIEFIKNVKSLEPINLYLYKKIKRKDPVFYKKLKSHARFFKNKKAVEQVSEEERIQKLEQYRQLISVAKANFHDTILGPLQNSQYSSLKFTGVIWGTMGSTALIEIPDGRGYSVKVNDLVGPNYGVVEKIGQNKIIVVERYVNYIEKIVEKRQEIKLSKSGEST